MKGNYADFTDIDLIMGAIAERPNPGATIGPTFACIIGKLIWFDMFETMLFLYKMLAFNSDGDNDIDSVNHMIGISIY